MNRPKKHKGIVHVFKKVTFPAWKVWRGASSAGRAMPNFIIIGAQKGGTTSLFEYLIQHPDVVAPLKKEVKFFDLNYQNGLGWYRAHFPFAYKVKPGEITGESSPNMLFHPLAAERTHRHLPNVRLIVLLRDPVERAYSHYQMNLRSGRDSLSFDEAVRQEPQRLEEVEAQIQNETATPQSIRDFINFSYLAKGEYAKQIERWRAFFPAEQMLVLQSEALFQHTQKTLDTAAQFLGLNPREAQTYPVHNPGEYSASVSPETRKFIIEYFRPHNRDLYELLGNPFDWQD